MVLLQGPTVWRFLISEVILYGFQVRALASEGQTSVNHHETTRRELLLNPKP